MAAGYCYCLGINSNAFFLNDYKKAFILGLNVPKVTAYNDYRLIDRIYAHEGHHIFCNCNLKTEIISGFGRY